MNAIQKAHSDGSPTDPPSKLPKAGRFHHRGLIVGWLGLLAIAVVTTLLSDDLSHFVQNAMDVRLSESLPTAFPPRMITTSFSSITLVAFAAIVMVDGFALKKIPILVASAIPIVAACYHWQSVWYSPGELRVLATLAFGVTTVIAFIGGLAMLARTAFGLRLASRPTTSEAIGSAVSGRTVSGRSVGLPELLLLTAVSALVAALSRHSYLSSDLFVSLALWVVLNAIATTSRVLALSEDRKIRWRSIAVSLIAFSGLRLYEESIAMHNAAVGGASVWVAMILAVLVNAIVYWFATMIPVLWMRANDWEVVSSPRTFQKNSPRATPKSQDAARTDLKKEAARSAGTEHVEA